MGTNRDKRFLTMVVDRNALSPAETAWLESNLWGAGSREQKIVASAIGDRLKFCEWKPKEDTFGGEDLWVTSCGATYSTSNYYGDTDFSYCPTCGGSVDLL